MVCFSAVIAETPLHRTFFGSLRPVSDAWLKEIVKDRPMFISDNNGFDWQFINWYFHHFLGKNPFGHSSTNLGSLYKGMVKETSRSFKHLRTTRHTHHPVDDALGNAEALLRSEMRTGVEDQAVKRL